MDEIYIWCPNDKKIQPVIVGDRVWPSQYDGYLQGEVICAVCHWPLMPIFKKI